MPPKKMSEKAVEKLKKDVADLKLLVAVAQEKATSGRTRHSNKNLLNIQKKLDLAEAALLEEAEKLAPSKPDRSTPLSKRGVNSEESDGPPSKRQKEGGSISDGEALDVELDLLDEAVERAEEEARILASLTAQNQAALARSALLSEVGDAAKGGTPMVDAVDVLPMVVDVDAGNTGQARGAADHPLQKEIDDHAAQLDIAQMEAARMIEEAERSGTMAGDETLGRNKQELVESAGSEEVTVTVSGGNEEGSAGHTTTGSIAAKLLLSFIKEHARHMGDQAVESKGGGFDHGAESLVETHALDNALKQGDLYTIDGNEGAQGSDSANAVNTVGGEGLVDIIQSVERSTEGSDGGEKEKPSGEEETSADPGMVQRGKVKAGKQKAKKEKAIDDEGNDDGNALIGGAGDAYALDANEEVQEGDSGMAVGVVDDIGLLEPIPPVKQSKGKAKQKGTGKGAISTGVGVEQEGVKGGEKKPKKEKAGGGNGSIGGDAAIIREKQKEYEGMTVLEKRAFDNFGAGQIRSWLKDPTSSINYKVRQFLRMVPNYLPQSATVSMRLTLYILASSRKNTRCLFHGAYRKMDKSDLIVEAATELSENNELSLTGVSGEARKGDDRIICLANDVENFRVTHLDCGCGVEESVFHFWMWKTWRLHGLGGLVVEPITSVHLAPHARNVIYQNFLKWGGVHVTLDGIFMGALVSEEEHRVHMLKHQLRCLTGELGGIYHTRGQALLGDEVLHILLEGSSEQNVESAIMMAGPSSNTAWA